ncbi:Hypothetical predicted protein [Lecanosticta acicola]|uniref:Uncharacterized protein n=1 Tax=Lecanosticta acicola TaxID=111012 RepID=A0AAI8Z4W7_9PEZI|nr:Hypothetical predicted protein [Lecanosticta acicola]
MQSVMEMIPTPSTNELDAPSLRKCDHLSCPGMPDEQAGQANWNTYADFMSRDAVEVRQNMKALEFVPAGNCIEVGVLKGTQRIVLAIRADESRMLFDNMCEEERDKYYMASRDRHSREIWQRKIVLVATPYRSTLAGPTEADENELTDQHGVPGFLAAAHVLKWSLVVFNREFRSSISYSDTWNKIKDALEEADLLNAEL